MPRIDLDVVTLKQVNSNLESDTNSLTGTYFPNVKNSISSVVSNVHNSTINSMLNKISGDVDSISQSINSNFKKVSDFILQQTTSYEKSEEEIVSRINNIISKIQEFNNSSVNKAVSSPSIFDKVDNANVSSSQTQVQKGMTPKLNNWITELEGEGPGTTTINGKEYYKAYADNGTYAASKGVQVIDNNGNKYLSNDAYLNKDGVIYVEKNAVDGLYNQEIVSKKNQVIAAANEHNVSLNEDQVNALTSYVYRTGTGRGQHEEAIIAYAEGGNEGLRDCMYSHASSTAAQKRVQAEYTLFTTGVYTDNPYDQPLQSY
ncbi:MAG: hypothetical protein IJO33_03775 [Bacilli bacterium]|nr:hypothetical protein [Bacilli bacterium]